MSLLTSLKITYGKNPSGIDIGTSSIKAIKLRRRIRETYLDAIGYINIPKDIKIPEENYKLSDSISQLIRTKRMGIKKVVSAISSPSLTIRYLTLPKMPKRDLSQAVKWEVKKQITFPSEELICDYVVLEEIAKEGGKLSIVAFAVKKSDVQEHLNILKTAFVEPVAVDVIPMALISAFDHNNIWEQGVNYVMVDVGKTKTNLAVFKDRMLRFAREIPFGGIDLTSSLQNSLGLSYEEAEERKINYGMLEETEHTIYEEKEVKKTRDIMTPVMEHLVLELHRSFDYYKVEFREGSISKIFLCGGTAKLRGIDRFLSETLDTPCFIDNPLKNIRINLKGVKMDEIRSLAPTLTVAVGLALRRVGE